MICPNCQSENKDGAKFCNDCGFPLTGRMAAVAAASTSDATLRSIAADDGPEDAQAGDSDPDFEGTASAVEPESAGEPDASGSLDRSSIPAIDVAGVNVDENGNAFDFGSIGDDEAAPKQKEFRAPDANQKKGGKGKIVAIVLVCLLAVGGAAAGVTYYLELWGGKMLPDVVGMTQSDAVYVLESKGFAVHEEKIKSDDTEGVVLLMDPVAGSREEEGSEVTIHVSEARTIPDVAGKQRDEAAALLEKDGFEKVSFVTEKSNEREGLVLGIAPEAGSKAAAGTEITVTVAVPFTVPDVKGKTWDEASKMLTDEGYEPVASYVYDDSVPAGTVLGTTPEADAKADSGSTVTVSVALSRGAELEQAALSYLGGLRDSGSTVTVGGTAYLVESVDAVKYEGGETTSFTITGKAVTSLDGETVYGSSKQKSGAIVWTSDNAIASIS